MKLHELVGQMVRATEQVRGLDARIEQLETRTARVERTLWIGVGILLTVQVMLGAARPSGGNNATEVGKVQADHSAEHRDGGPGRPAAQASGRNRIQ